MILDNLIKRSIKFNVKVRFVEEYDAQKILELRTNEKLNKFLHYTSDDLEQQIEYIRNYKKKESKGVEYYLAFTDLDNKTLGFYRLYNINYAMSSFTIGSWIFDPERTDNTAIFADILSKKFGFVDLGLMTCFFEVNRQNKKVMKYHQLFFPTFLHEDDEENHYFSLSKSEFIKNANNILNLIS